MSAGRSMVCHGEAATLGLGRALAAGLRPGTVVALHGDLGAGKTVLSRGIARGLGITEAVTSPTFTVVQEYLRTDGTYLFHLDLYRIRDEAAALAFGVDEYLFAGDGITLVEWPERIPALLVSPGPGRELFALRLEHLEADVRRITVPAGLDRWIETAAPADGCGVHAGAGDRA